MLISLKAWSKLRVLLVEVSAQDSTEQIELLAYHMQVRVKLPIIISILEIVPLGSLVPKCPQLLSRGQ